MIRSAAIGVSVLAAAARAQCSGWIPVPGDWSPYAAGEVLTAAAFDPDGPGPQAEQLFVGGSSMRLPGAPPASLYRWDGSRWWTFGGAFDGSVMALRVWNGDLYAGGDFTAIGGQSAAALARWTGTAWAVLPGGLVTRQSGVPTVRGMAEFDGRLVMVGGFDRVGDLPSANVVLWDGSAFHAAGSGVNGYARAAVEHEGRLVVGGDFTAAGGQSASHLAAWDGSAWRRVGTSASDQGVNGLVRALASEGGSLFIGGQFSTAGLATAAANIARWDGVRFWAMGGGTSAMVRGLVPVPEGILVLGGFRFVSGVDNPGMAVWTGGQWSTALGGLGLDVYAGGASASGIAALPWGGSWVVTGFFDRVGGVSAPGVAVHGAQGWAPLGGGLAGGTIAATAVYRGEVYAGGRFQSYAGRVLGGLARWDGRGWAPVPGWAGGSTVGSLVVADDRLWVSGSLAPSGDPTEGTTAAAFFEGSVVVYAQGGRASSAGRAAFWRGRLVLPAGASDASSACWDGAAWSELSAGSPPAPLKLRHVAVYGGDLYGDVDGRVPAEVVRSEGDGWVTVPPPGIDGIGDLIVAGGRLCAGGGTWNSSYSAWDGSDWVENQEQYAIARLAPTSAGLFASAIMWPGDDRLVRVDPATGHGTNVAWPLERGMLGLTGSAVGDFFGVLIASESPYRGYAHAGAHALYVSGAPVIIGQPEPPRDGADPRVDVVAIGMGLAYQWRRDGMEILGATGPELAISRAWIAGSYDCVVSNGCGAVVSDAVRIESCAGDHDGDGFADFFDYLAFVADFEAGDPAADVNADGLIDYFDYADFVAVFEGGC